MSDSEWSAAMARLLAQLDACERHLSDCERIMRSADSSRDGFAPGVADCIADDPRLLANILAPWPNDEEATT